MADYPRILPATLANWLPVTNDPTDFESADKLAQVDLQTRRFVYDYLLTKFDSSTEFLLPAVLGPGTLTNRVSGAQGNASPSQDIVASSVSTPDLRDQCVSTAKLADGAVTTAKIGTAQITADLMAPNSVTVASIPNGSIGTTQLAPGCVDSTILKSDATGIAGAVTSQHIQAGAVTSSKLASGAVTSSALMPGSIPGQLLIAGDSPYQFTPQAMSGGATIDKNGVITLRINNISFLAERQNNGIACGASITGYQVRGSVTVWTEIWRVSPTAFVTTTPAGHISLPPGLYIVEATAPAYKSNQHICRLVRYNGLNAFQESYYGTSANTYVSGGNSDQSATLVKAFFNMAPNDYIQLEHYINTADPAGLGAPSNSGGTYEIYATMLIRSL